MKYKLFLIILLVNCTVCLSQSELAKKGTITLADNQRITFNHLRLLNGKFVFADVTTSIEREISTKEVKYIEDDKMSRIFTNKTLEKADLKLEAEQKQLANEEGTKKEITKQKALEELKTASAFGLYPNGIYATKEDFVNKKPINQEELIAKEVAGLEKETYEGIPDECFFYYLKSDKKVKSSFAVSYKGQLYFQIEGILSNRNKTDRSQSNEYPNSYVRVKIHGENYYYVEADLGNFWAESFSYGGGALGAAIATSNVTYKGIVWDLKNKEFNIFKSCVDYNEFIKDKYPEGIQKCEKHKADILLIRKAIERIK